MGHNRIMTLLEKDYSKYLLGVLEKNQTARLRSEYMKLFGAIMRIKALLKSAKLWAWIEKQYVSICPN